MKLEITPPADLDIKDFVNNFLLDKIPAVYIKSVDRLRLLRFDNYLNSLNIATKTRTGKVRKINTFEVLYSAFNNLVVAVDSGTYTITINPNTMVPNFNIKLITVAELVNYGTVSIQSYPIIDEVFDKVADDLGTYYIEYLAQEVEESGN